jgi:hypothetical protein
MYASSLIFSFAIIVFRVDGGRPSCLATSVLFPDEFFFTSSEIRSGSSKVQTCFKGNTFGEKFLLKENDDYNNKKHC